MINVNQTKIISIIPVLFFLIYIFNGCGNYKNNSEENKSPNNSLKLSFDNAVIPNKNELEETKKIIEQRLSSIGIDDVHVLVNYSSLTLTIECNEDIKSRISKMDWLFEQCLVEFREGSEKTGKLILDSNLINKASVNTNSNNIDKNNIAVTLTETGTQCFSEATERISKTNGIISVWIDNQLLMPVKVKNKISNGIFIINTNFNYSDAQLITNKINFKSLPFPLVVDDNK